MDNLKAGWQSFISLCHNNPDEKNLAAVLDLFLTPEEKNNLATRYLIIKALLTAQCSQRQIAKELQVSIAKITRGSNELKRIDKKLIAHLKNLIR